MLKGVGPKLEATLNELGIFHFDQVASWGPQEITWVDSRLKFKGRIERDGWIEQAKTLASGGETEFFQARGSRRCGLQQERRVGGRDAEGSGSDLHQYLRSA
ncbi:hypothetical protein QW131_10620 [Roseibium salinum]|nr:hypothetical protein [Roseibium salinum]